jgi:hypothetical protein
VKFPSHELKPKSGDIYAHIFENSTTGLARDLFWSITIEFEPLEYGDDEFQCAMTCEWVRWPIRDWRDLDGKQLDARYGDDGLEASFYMSRHDVAHSARLSIHRVAANDFRVSMEMQVDFHGYYGGDEVSDMPVKADSVIVPFTGLVVVPGNLFPKPTTVKDVEAVAREFVNMDCYDPPEEDRHRYVLRPRVETDR